WWKATAFDDHVNVSVVYNFTTAPQSWVNRAPTFSNPSPMNGSTGQPLSLTWGIPINDPDGDLFSWTIQCSNGQNNSGTAANNGTKTLALSVLAYSTSYKVWVNATDPTGSSNYTRKWYNFTTKNVDGGGQPPVVPPGPSNKNPIADTSAGEPYKGFVDSAILFDGSRSYDTDGNIITWFWIFGDNTNKTGRMVNHTYSKAGTYLVALTVTDNEGAKNIDMTSCLIKQQNRPPAKPTITGPTSGTKNTIYTYTALSTDADNDTIQYTFNWSESISQPSEFLPNATNYTVNHSWTAAGRYDITVTVTDNITESSSGITIYIDALQTRGAGYLLDNDGDGIYDAFYSDQYHQTTTIQKKDDSYLIDSNGDGTWDYIYNTTKGLTDYREPRNTPGFEIIIIIGALALVIFWKRKRKDNN
ncbi:MAG TPA: PKD domain-containing protein, partial [Candidatus Thermoplasmatota archaeon]|nr:PKD domain-containing protein [Candidatus Thermoplasmatota archaeon]